MRTVVHKAGWVVVKSDTVVRDGFVKVEAGMITEVGSGPITGGNVVDHGEGALVPAFVNAHTHLELTGLANKVVADKGFKQWVKDLLKARETAGYDFLQSEAAKGVAQLIESGVVVAGEVSTLGITADLFASSPLSGVWFREILGNRVPEDAVAGNGVRDSCCSFAAHAPHTTAPDVIKELKKLCKARGQVFSIHLAESDEELEFIRTGRGSWGDFLRKRGIDFSSWPIGAKSPVEYLAKTGVLDKGMLAVHLVHADRSDIKLVAESGVNVCLCLRSNARLHGRMPDVVRMVAAGVPLCLGTDSLASVDSLGILDEMAFMSYKFPSIPASVVFAMATENGAKALGVGRRFGTLEPGKTGALVYLPVRASNRADLFDSIVSAGGMQVSVIL